jgi:hypothetical protein
MALIVREADQVRRRALRTAEPAMPVDATGG